MTENMPLIDNKIIEAYEIIEMGTTKILAYPNSHNTILRSRESEGHSWNAWATHREAGSRFPGQVELHREIYLIVNRHLQAFFQIVA